MTAFNFMRVLTLEGLGWKDIHATNLEYADPSAQIEFYEFAFRHKISLNEFVFRYTRLAFNTKLSEIKARLRKKLSRG